MKTFLLLFVTSALIAIQLTTASPVQVVQAFNDGAEKETVATLPKVNELNVGRQQTPQQIAPVAVEEDDDDDDDDDDDLDIPLDDDDDDDDDEEGDDDDDDDDDYLERFFDDILGEDDDDDDDDDLSPSTGIVQAVPQPQQTQAVAANVGDETLAEYPVEDEVSNNAVEVDSIQDGVDIVGPDSALKDQAADGQAIASVQPQASNQQVSAAAAADDDDDDDDDDEEDVLEEALDDDDDDDDDDEDDDDDDDELIGEDVISARAHGRKGRKARATPALNSTEETEKSITPAQIVSSTEILTSTPMAEAAAKNDENAPTTISSVSSIPVPDALVYRYNRYIDNIFERISAILKRSYDPVNVRLTSITRKSGAKNQPGQKKKKKRNHDLGRSNNEDVNEGKARTDCIETDQSNECSVAAKSNTQKAVPATVATAHITKQKSGQPVETKATTVRRKVSSAAAKQKSSLKADTTKPQQQVINRARGTLHGLSTIKRHGNVRVTPTPEYLSVRSDFVLGPLVLKVEKSFGRGAKRETKRATATTTQMVGRINLRIVDDKATLHSIKVQQPKQVKVDSADNHDRTRKFVWQKSSHIAQVVSSKLASVAQDFLQQPAPSVEA